MKSDVNIEPESYTGLPGQVKIAVLFIFAIFLICLWVYVYLPSGMLYSLLFGLMVGFVLQRSRICFTAALRDPFLFGMTGVLRALILSLIITTIGFSIFQYLQVSGGAALPGKIISPGLNIPIGGIIFGIGAAISGGCASGTLVRMGEGFQLQWLAFVGFVFGSVHGAYDAGFWYQFFRENFRSHLPEIFGWKSAILIQLMVLILLYYYSYHHEKKRFDL